MNVSVKNCNSITDFDYKPYDGIIILGDIKKRFPILNKKILLEGYCDKYRKKGKNFSPV
jgi:hypothetical protein